MSRLKYYIVTIGMALVLSCKEDDPGILPSVSTGEVSNIGGNVATCGGEVLDTGNSELLAVGVVASENPNPTLSDGISTTLKNLSLGTFSSDLAGLRSNTTYFIRAFATNKAGTAYGEDRTFKTVQVIPTAIDFSELTKIQGYNFTQAIGFEGSVDLQSLFLANRQINPPVIIQYERLFRYDLLNNSSASIFNPITDYISKEIQIVDNKIIIVGGQFVSTYQFDLVEQPIVVHHNRVFSRHGSGQMNGNIYAYGGDLNGIDSDKIWLWDESTEAFQSIAIMPTAKSYAGGEIVNSKLYVFGGQKEFSATLHDDIIYVYSFNENNFETLHLPEALYRTFTARVGDYIYLAGHVNPTGFDNTDLFFGVFNTLDNIFTEIDINLTDNLGASIWAMTAVDNHLYVVYGDPLIDFDQLSGEQTFTIQKAEIP